MITSGNVWYRQPPSSIYNIMGESVRRKVRGSVYQCVKCWCSSGGGGGGGESSGCHSCGVQVIVIIVVIGR